MTASGLGQAPVDGRVGAALDRGDFSAAVALLREAEQQRPLTPEELDLLGRSAYGAGQFEAAITAWEQQSAACHSLGDEVAAAAAATTVAMFLMMDTGLMAPVRGWLARAERLLGDRPESPTHALLAMTHTYERFMCGDADASARWAEQAIDLGGRHDVPLAAALGRVATARLMILDGAVEPGLALLDEAAVSVVSGELDALGAGMVYCELICAMQGLAQYDRAEQWTEAMERWRVGHAYGGLIGRCRVHRAEILRLRGACSAAADEALEACRELRPWMRREFGWPLTELGAIRLRTGDLVGAETALLEALAHGWDPQPWLALLRLAQGRVGVAAAMIADALEHPCAVPSKEWPPLGALRRAPLLAAQAEICIAAGDVEAARTATGQLSGIAETYRSRALSAAAALARGRLLLAERDAEAAVGECEEAVTGWSDVGAPYEAAVAQLVLADAERLLGRVARAELHEQAARATAARIGAPLAGGHPTRAPSSPTPSECVFRRDGDVRTVAFAGRTVVVRDLKGMRYLARLLAEPDREFHVLDLVGGETGERARPGGDLGPVLDGQARAAYRRRLAEIDDDLAEAEALGDDTRLALAQADRDYLLRELAGAFGLGGRVRVAGSASERARASVSRSLRYAVCRIAEHHPALADHLVRTVRTGTYCCYVPDPRIPTSWEL
ncbi:transcriptional regulator [Blastococcus sp. BMG 814]|uniref:Transcriptional regulator n=1 Tax=Blastococcus carthaginiensis TaxID=3050034 RepID=A0ABT9I932_9ACTN|nr:transcriptional regulator [Blastococcus carthaginiensis]MDP5182073.1 transcriptional regulator [Blastococcus carthaginiensis]